MARFCDLAEIVFGEDEGVLLLGGVQRGITDIEQIGAERKMWTVLFQDSEGEQARPLGAMNSFAKVGGGEFFPVDGKLRGKSGSERNRARSKEQPHRRQESERACDRCGSSSRISLGGEF